MRKQCTYSVYSPMGKCSFTFAVSQMADVAEPDRLVMGQNLDASETRAASSVSDCGGESSVFWSKAHSKSMRLPMGKSSGFAWFNLGLNIVTRLAGLRLSIAPVSVLLSKLSLSMGEEFEELPVGDSNDDADDGA